MVIQSFRNFGAVLALLALISPIFAHGQQGRPAQTKPRTPPAKKPAAGPKRVATPKVDPAKEKSRFEAAVAAATAREKAELLVKFIADYPKSALKVRAEESLTGARAAMADESLTAGDPETAVRLFKLAIERAPKPYSERLFSEVIATIPANLYWRGHRAEGIELAKLIETHIATDVNKLLLLSTFFLGSENGGEAKRIAEAAIKLDEKNAAAHQTLATAHRLNFDLESSAASFAKAVELDPESSISKRSLADMKRAIGKSDEAEKIYRDILTVNEKDNQARTGLVLALFDLGKRADAEAEMAKALEEAPGNVVLLAGAAYWYAANKDGDKAVQYARRAVEKEPRYIWSHIAFGRGLMLQGKPVEAEQLLVSARKYGNFPTLQYEIASARLAAGFFREAAEELTKSFRVADGSVSTRLGGRVEQSADSFTKAIDMERRASIFSPQAADSAEDAARLKALMELSDRLAADTKDEAAIVTAAESFAGGDDNMSVHRKLYAANLLLQNGVATDEAVKLSSAAVAGLDRSLDVANPGAAVMATELYEARNISFSREDFLLIPDVPRQTLNSLMRGRVEETTGLALLRQGKAADATVRFRRALTVLPKDSAWWRSAMWNLGSSLAAEGKEKEALDTMVASYAIDKPNPTRFLLIEQLWTKVNGNRDGLEEKIGPNPLPNFTAAAKPETTPEPPPSPTVETITANESEAKTAATTEVSPTPRTTPSPEAAMETVKPSPTPDASPPSEVLSEIIKSSATPEVSPSPEVVSDALKSTPTPDASPSPEVVSEAVKSTPTPEISPSPEVVSEAVKSTPTPEVSPSPEVVPEAVRSTPTPEASPSPEVVPETVRSTPTPEVSPSPEAVAEPVKASTPNPTPTPSESPSPETTPLVASESLTPSEKTVGKTEPRNPRAPLFEPIVITIPKPTADGKAARKRSVDDASPAEETKETNEPASGGEIARPRIVKGKAITGELLPCEIGVSRESVSLTTNGGSISLLVSIEQGEDIKLVKGVSSSAADVEVSLESDRVSVSGRSTYVIRSISEKTGMYQVTFTAPCGKRDVIVRVR